MYIVSHYSTIHKVPLTEVILNLSTTIATKWEDTEEEVVHYVYCTTACTQASSRVYGWTIGTSPA